MKNRFSVEGDVAFIHVGSRIRPHRVAVDVADLELVKPLKGTWSLINTANGLRARARVEDPLTPSCSTTVYMHRLIARAYPKDRVLHRDGDGLNNRRSNLLIERNATTGRSFRST